jgi:isochorismate hydrolase
MDDPDKPRQWLAELAEFGRHMEHSPSKLCRSALLVIDMQNFFLEDSSHAYVPASSKIIGNVNHLISIYENYKLPVVYTRYAFLENEETGIMARWWNDIVRENSKEAEISPEINVPEGSTILRKTKYDSFQDTDLLKILTDASVKTVVVTGVMTHLCCETTARSAFTNDLDVYFPIDANATTNEELHMSSLKTLSSGFAVPCLTDELISSLENALKECGENEDL